MNIRSALACLPLILLFMLTSQRIDAQEIIDVHCHNVPASYLEELNRNNAALDEGFPIPSWNEAAHLAFMAEAGIATSVLTMPAPQPYFGGSAACARTVREYNLECARLAAEHPGRFIFCAALPLPDVEAAVSEAVFALDSLGACGVKLATNSCGQYLGDEALEPLMKVLSERDAVVIIHPHKPVPVNSELMAALPLAAYEYPAETTRAVFNMLVHNVFERYPGIKWVVPHCGSFLPLALPRLKSLLPALQAAGLVGKVDVEASLSRLWYDLAGAATPKVIRSLLTITEPGHIMYGSDYPYQPANVLISNASALADSLAADPGLAPYKDDIMRGNAARLFGLAGSAGDAEGAGVRSGAGDGDGLCAGAGAGDGVGSGAGDGGCGCRGAVKVLGTAGTGTRASVSAGVEDVDAGSGAVDGDGDAGQMLVRISEIEVYPEYLDEYLEFALNVGATSVREEPGVIAIYPMVQQRDSCQIRILEIYANQDAYKHHITTDHFQTYKQGTLHMVKSLDLVDMHPMDPAAMPLIFKKL